MKITDRFHKQAVELTGLIDRDMLNLEQVNEAIAAALRGSQAEGVAMGLEEAASFRLKLYGPLEDRMLDLRARFRARASRARGGGR